MKSLYPPTHVKTRARVLLGWALVLALLITILTSGIGLTVQAEEKQVEEQEEQVKEEQQEEQQGEQPQQEPQQEPIKGITVFYHDVVKGKVLSAFETGWPMVARDNPLKLQYKLTEMADDGTDTGNAISDLEVRLVDADDADNEAKIFARQTTDKNGMVTFEVTEDNVKNLLCHRIETGHKDQDFPQTIYYGFLATEDGGYNQKLIAYNICLKNAETKIGDKTYRGMTNRAPLACFTFKDTKVCKLELTPLTLDYGADFNKMDVVTRVGFDWQGEKKEFDFKNDGVYHFIFYDSKGNPVADTNDGVYEFTFKNPAGELVDTIDTTKPGVYTVSVTIYPFGKENGKKNYSWCWDTQTTTVTVKPIPYIKCPPMCQPMCPTTVVQSVTPIPPVSQPTAVTPLNLPATGSVDAGLTIVMSLGLALLGLWLKKRN